MKRLKVIGVIQARLGSTRLPGKVLKKISGKTVVQIIFERLLKAKDIDEVILAIPRSRENDPLAAEGKRIGVKVYRGSEKDLISRFLGAASLVKEVAAIVRITADCVFVDPAIVDTLVRSYRMRQRNYDYFTNNDERTFPHGLDAEVLPLRTLRRLDRRLKRLKDREWFAPYMKERPNIFRIYNLTSPRRCSEIRIVLDYPKDLILLRRIYKCLSSKKNHFGMNDILDFLKERPTLLEINKEHIERFATD